MIDWLTAVDPCNQCIANNCNDMSGDGGGNWEERTSRKRKRGKADGGDDVVDEPRKMKKRCTNPAERREFSQASRLNLSAQTECTLPTRHLRVQISNLPVAHKVLAANDGSVEKDITQSRIPL